MVLLAHGFHKLSSRLEDHLHRRDHRLPPDFESRVGDVLRKLLLNSDTRSDFFSFPWIHRLLLLIPEINKAFAELVVELEHPICEWKSDSVDEYLNYKLNLLELFNSMTSSLSHLSRDRILISYALFRARTSPSSARDRLKPIQQKKVVTHNLKKKEIEETEKQSKKSKPTKDSTIRQALRILRGVGMWICGIAVTGLQGDETPYWESRKWAMEVKIDTLNRLDSEIYKEGSEKKWVVNEIRDLNEAVGRLMGAIEGGESGEAEKEVEKKVGELERQLEGIEKEVNRLFSEVLAGRTQIVRCLATAEEKEKHW